MNYYLSFRSGSLETIGFLNLAVMMEGCPPDLGVYVSLIFQDTQKIPYHYFSLLTFNSPFFVYDENILPEILEIVKDLAGEKYIPLL